MHWHVAGTRAPLSSRAVGAAVCSKLAIADLQQQRRDSQLPLPGRACMHGQVSELTWLTLWPAVMAGQETEVQNSSRVL